jgi:hypothetical protein
VGFCGVQEAQVQKADRVSRHPVVEQRLTIMGIREYIARHAATTRGHRGVARGHDSPIMLTEQIVPIDPRRYGI